MRIIRKSLLIILSIQLEIHKIGSKINELKEIWKVDMSGKPSPKQYISSIMLSIVILVTWMMFWICTNMTWIIFGYIIATKIFNELY